MGKYAKQKYDIFKTYNGAPLGNKNAAKNPDDVRKNRTFKASSHEWEIIQSNAQKAGMSVSDFIRFKTMQIEM